MAENGPAPHPKRIVHGLSERADLSVSKFAPCNWWHNVVTVTSIHPPLSVLKSCSFCKFCSIMNEQYGVLPLFYQTRKVEVTGHLIASI